MTPPLGEKRGGQVSCSYRVIEAAEQGVEKPCKKIILTVRCTAGGPVTPGKLAELALQVACPLFSRGEGWDLREVKVVEYEAQLTLGKRAEAPEYSFEERKHWGELAAAWGTDVAHAVAKFILEQAMAWAKEQRPLASVNRHCAFANSVMTAITGWFGGYGGPSVREHAAVRVIGRPGSCTFAEAVELLGQEFGPIFGPITYLHRDCWEDEQCFNDDPHDVAELSSSSGYSPDNGRG